MRPRSRLERVLRAGRFAVTAELNPPDCGDAQCVYDRALVLASVCDAINATDASGANVHMSSVGVCALLTRAWVPVRPVAPSSAPRWTWRQTWRDCASSGPRPWASPAISV